MLIVVSDEKFRAGEAIIINQLLDNGLEIFHLRKPYASKAQVDEFLNEIDKKYYSKIVLHQHHFSAEKFGINRLHFPEKERVVLEEADLVKLKEKRFILSTSIHQIGDWQNLPRELDYSFYGPVFDSISKQGYKAKESIKIVKNGEQVKLVALGGVSENNLSEAKKMGFDGVAVLGAIWQSENPVASFKNIKEAWSKTGQ